MYEMLTIVGNLGRDPAMKYTPSGKAVTNFSVAVNARWTNGDGTNAERVTWYKVACWGKLAEVTNEYLAKGRRVLVVASRIEAVTTEGRRILSTRRASRVRPSE